MMIKRAAMAGRVMILPIVCASLVAVTFPFLPHATFRALRDFRALEHVDAAAESKSNPQSGSAKISRSCIDAVERSDTGAITVFLDDPRCRTIFEANSVTKKLVYGDPLEAGETAVVPPGSVKLEDVRYDLRKVPEGLEKRMQNKYGFKVRGIDKEREAEICRAMKRIAVTYLAPPDGWKSRNLFRHLHRQVLPANGWNDTSLFFITGIGKPRPIAPNRSIFRKVSLFLFRMLGQQKELIKPKLSHDELVRRLREESERERDMILSPFVETYEVMSEKVHGALSFVSRCRASRASLGNTSKSEAEQKNMGVAELLLHMDDDSVLNWPLFYAAMNAGPDVFWKKEWREMLVKERRKYSETVAVQRKREAESMAEAEKHRRKAVRVIKEAHDIRLVDLGHALPDLVGRIDCLDSDAPLIMGHTWANAPIERKGKYAQYEYVKGDTYPVFVGGPHMILNGQAVDRIATAYENDRAHYKNGDLTLAVFADRAKVCAVDLPGMKSNIWDLPSGCFRKDGRRRKKEALPPSLRRFPSEEAVDFLHCPCSLAFTGLHCLNTEECRRDGLNRLFFPCNKTLSKAVLWKRDGEEAQHLRYFDRVAASEDPQMPPPIASPNDLPLSFW